MQKMPFSDEEVELAQELKSKGVFWRPKSSDWFLDFGSLRVLYNGEYQQSISLCLVLDEDGRSMAFLELLIDNEENGNRMKKSASYSDRNKMDNFMWVPSIKDCINIVERSDDYSFISIEKIEESFKVSIKEDSSGKIISQSAQTELTAFYNAILSL